MVDRIFNWRKKGHTTDWVVSRIVVIFKEAKTRHQNGRWTVLPFIILYHTFERTRNRGQQQSRTETETKICNEEGCGGKRKSHPINHNPHGRFSVHCCCIFLTLSPLCKNEAVVLLGCLVAFFCGWTVTPKEPAKCQERIICMMLVVKLFSELMLSSMVPSVMIFNEGSAHRSG